MREATQIRITHRSVTTETRHAALMNRRAARPLSARSIDLRSLELSERALQPHSVSQQNRVAQPFGPPAPLRERPGQKGAKTAQVIFNAS